MTDNQSTDINPFAIFNSIRDESYIFAKNSGPLHGEVEINGAKNMVTKVIAASLSGESSTVKIKNIPLIGELLITLNLCKNIGIPYKINPDHTLNLTITDFTDSNVKFEGGGNRISILFAGPVLSKLKEAHIDKLGGDKIGERKINFHLEGFKEFGVNIEEHDDYYSLYLKDGKLKAADITLPYPSVGATENLIIMASCADGVTTIKNAAIEPEIIEMVKILQRSGVPITLDANRTYVIKGGTHKMPEEIEVIPDRLEAFSYAVAALTTKGDIFVRNARQDHLLSPISKLIEAGVGVEIKDNGIRFYYKGDLNPLNIRTDVFPGFATDLQNFMALLLSQSNGTSNIHETVHENRFGYLEKLIQMSNNESFVVKTACPVNDSCRFADSNLSHVAEIKGSVKFNPSTVSMGGEDIRASFAIVNAALLTEGTTIKDLKSLYRGYEDPIGKLKSLGANIDLFL